MSIQTELTRLTNAKNAIKAAIEGKGVTVPGGTLLDGMAALIEGISAVESNIIVGSFTLTETLTTASPLYIDVTFPKNEFPLMYCVFEDTSGLDVTDTSHTMSRARYIIAARTIEIGNSICYFAISSYNKAGSYTMNYVGDSVIQYGNGYSNAGGIYGSMGVSLKNNQIRFEATANGQPYLVGRTYRYILYWSD